MSGNNYHNPDPSQLQGQAQGQLNGQGQLQGQLNAQAQGQGQLGLQAQGQGQGQGQGQSQSQNEAQTAAQAVAQSVDSSNANGNLNGNGNGNFNGNLDANGNLNGNANGNLNESANHVDNSLSNTDSNVNSTTDSVTNSVDNTVNTAVNVSVAVDVAATQPLTDASINVSHLDGILFQMPETVSQYVNGDGNNSIFDLNQVNNLVSNGHLDSASVSFSVDSGGLLGASLMGDGHDPAGIPTSIFSQVATATGGQASSDNASVTTHDSSAAVTAGTSDASAPITQDAFTQSIVMGANIQFNSATFNVVGHDSITTDAGAAMGGHH